MKIKVQEWWLGEEFTSQKSYSQYFFRSNGGVIVHSMPKGRNHESFPLYQKLPEVCKEIKKQKPLTGVHGIKLLLKCVMLKKSKIFWNRRALIWYPIHLIHQIYFLVIIGSTIILYPRLCLSYLRKSIKRPLKSLLREWNFV